MTYEDMIKDLEELEKYIEEHKDNDPWTKEQREAWEDKMNS